MCGTQTITEMIIITELKTFSELKIKTCMHLSSILLKEFAYFANSDKSLFSARDGHCRSDMSIVRISKRRANRIYIATDFE